MEQEITIFARERKTSSGVTFISFSYRSKEGDFYTVKFTKKCPKIPEQLGYLRLKFNLEDSNVKYDANGYGTIYLNSYISYVEDKEAIEKSDKARAEKMKLFFN